MSLEYSIRMLAGTMVLLSLSLGHYVHTSWNFLAVFVAINLIQSTFTKWCLAETVLKKYVYNNKTR